MGKRNGDNIAKKLRISPEPVGESGTHASSEAAA
jgi:hypothetical protein